MVVLVSGVLEDPGGGLGAAVGEGDAVELVLNDDGLLGGGLDGIGGERSCTRGGGGDGRRAGVSEKVVAAAG